METKLKKKLLKKRRSPSIFHIFISNFFLLCHFTKLPRIFVVIAPQGHALDGIFNSLLDQRIGVVGVGFTMETFSENIW